jgi:Rhs family protein
VVGDFNNDGLADVGYVVGNALNCNLDLWVWLSNGNAMQSPVQMPLYSGTACQIKNDYHQGLRVVAGDFDSNGTTQLLAAWPVREVSSGSPFDGFAYVKLKLDLAQATATAESTGWADPGPAATSPQMLVGDVNGDGIPDVVVTSSDGSKLGIVTLLGPTLANQVSSSISSSANGAALADLNGDGVAEMLFFRQDGYNITVGVAQADGMGSFLPRSNTNTTVPTYDAYQPVVADLNGDGYNDVAWVETGGGAHHIVPMLSKGFQQFDVQPVINAVPGSLPLGPIIGGDFDGDGLAEIAMVSVNARSMRIAHFRGAQHLKLSQITDGFSAYVRVHYASQVQGGIYSDDGAGATFPVRLLHVPQSLVSEVRTLNPGHADRVVDYRYEGARFHAQGLGFLGFSSVTVSDLTTGNVETTKYSQTFPYIGMATAQTTTHGNLTLSRTTTQYANITTAGAARFPYPQGSTATSYEIEGNNRPFSSTQTANTYNRYGELTESNVAVNDIGSGATFLTYTTHQYQDDPTRWLLGRLTQTQVTRSDNVSGQSITRTSTFTYDPGTGLLASEEVEPNDQNHWMRTDYIRDGFGNITATTVTGADIPARRSTKQYSALAPYYGRFKTKACNALNQCAVYSYDATTGNVTSSTNANGITTTFHYDVFGRATGQTVDQPQAGGLHTASSVARFWCSDAPALCFGSPNGVWGEHSTSSSGRNAVVVQDATGRELLRGAVNGKGTWVLVRTLYDALGRKAQVSTPFFSNSTEKYWTTTQYDALNRPISVTAPIDADHSTGAVTRYSYAGLSTTITNPRGFRTTKTYNALGKVIAVVDAGGNTVRYGYDPYANLVSVTDSAGNVTTMAYDIRGHKTEMKDPDMGTWKYTYDTLGELLSQRDAKLQTISMQYDVLGRMVSRTEKEDVTTWDYDSLWKGALTRVTVTSNPVFGAGTVTYQRSYTYTPFGSPATTLTTIDDQHYTFRYSYDNQGRTAGITYPNGLATAIHYNANGAEDRIYQPGNFAQYYWIAKDWDEFGKPYDEVYGNSVETVSYRDDAVGRVSAILAGPGGTDTITSTQYTWDADGNLTNRRDIDRGNLNEAVSYDALDRMTGVTTSGDGIPTFAQNTAYDALGNITTKSDVGAYQYGALGAGPHAVTKVDGAAYTYDANGNLKHAGLSGGRSYTWSSYNLPTDLKVAAGASQSGGAEARFEYGPDREKVRQVNQPAGGMPTTIDYVGGGLFERWMTGASTTGKAYILTPNGMAAVVSIYNQQIVATYFHHDNLGSIIALERCQRHLVQRYAYDAWGRRTLVSNPGGLAALGTQWGYTGHVQLDDLNLST